jgi:hypothetical protein
MAWWLTSCSITIWNSSEGSSWKLETYEKLGFQPIDPELLDFLKKEDKTRKAKKKLGPLLSTR